MSNFNSVNQVILVGRLVRNVEHKIASIGQIKRDYVRFTIATNEMYYSKTLHETTSRAEYHACVAWGAAAKFVWKYGVRGRVVSVLGKLRHNKFEDKDGNKKYATQVNVDELTFIGRKDEIITPKEEAMTEDERDRAEIDKGKSLDDINKDPYTEEPF